METTIGTPQRDSAEDVRCSALKPLVALAVVSAAFLDPLQPAIAIAGLVRVVLIEARLHASLAGRFL